MAVSASRPSAAGPETAQIRCCGERRIRVPSGRSATRELASSDRFPKTEAPARDGPNAKNAKLTPPVRIALGVVPREQLIAQAGASLLHARVGGSVDLLGGIGVVVV